MHLIFSWTMYWGRGWGLGTGNHPDALMARRMWKEWWPWDGPNSAYFHRMTGNMPSGTGRKDIQGEWNVLSFMYLTPDFSFHMAKEFRHGDGTEMSSFWLTKDCPSSFIFTMGHFCRIIWIRWWMAGLQMSKLYPTNWKTKYSDKNGELGDLSFTMSVSQC